MTRPNDIAELRRAPKIQPTTKAEKISARARERAKSAKGRLEIESAVASNTPECILWTGAVHHRGYGVTAVNRKQIGAHRLVCIKAHGEPPFPEAVARHKCKTPRCINPRHLEWGTSLENTLDRIDHGTMLYGEDTPNAKLTASQVRAIRAEPLDLLHSVVGEKYGVTGATVSHIRRRLTWRHLD